MMGLRVVMVAGFVSVLLAGCTTPSVRYYTLAALPQPVARDTAPSPSPPPSPSPDYGLRLEVLQVPADVDRPQVVVRDPRSDPSVQVLNESLWAAPLKDEVQTSLVQAVARALGVPDVRGLPDTGLPVRRIDVRLNHFALVWGQAVELSASWTDQGADSPVLSRLCKVRVVLPASTGVAALVAQQRQALRVLAAAIASPDANGITCIEAEPRQRPG